MRVPSKAAAATTVAVGMLVTAPGVASAHYVYEEGTVATWGDNCTVLRSEVSHGSAGGGYTRTDVKSRRKETFTGTPCIEPYDRPPGYISARYWYYKKVGSRWAVCRQIGEWRYNTRSDRNFVLSYNFGAIPPCGNGYYKTGSQGRVLDDGVWHGGSMFSGQHYLPPQ